MTAEAMPRSQRAYVIAMCAIIGAAFAYAASEWGQWPRLTYLALSGDVTFEPNASPTAMRYLGLILWGFGGIAVGALIGALLVRLVPRPWSERVIHLFGAWAITAILLAGCYFTWSLWPWM